MTAFNTAHVRSLNADGKLEEIKMQKSVYLKHTSEVYPRFNRDFIDFKDRFKNVTGRLEEVLRDPELERELQELDTFFKKPVEVIIVSKDPVELESCVKLKPLSRQQEQQHKNSVLEDPGITYVLGFIKVNDEEKGIEEVLAFYNHLMSLQNRPHSDNIFLICELNKSFTKAKTSIFVEKVKENTPELVDKSLIEHEHVIIVENVPDKNFIAKHLERKVINTFEKVEDFLRSFIRLKRAVKDQNKSDIYNEVNMTIQNKWPMPLDCFEGDLNALLEIIADTITQKLSDYYLLPIKLCRKLSKESNFVGDFNSFSIQTNNLLPESDNETSQLKIKVKEYARNYEESLSKRLDLVKKHTQVIRTMIVEIERNLKSCFGSRSKNDKLLIDEEVPKRLREDLLKIKGVNGVGMIAGVLEVHVNSNDVIEKVKTESIECFEEHDYKRVFDVKPFEGINQLYFPVSSGDKINESGLTRFATLGLVVRGSDGQVYGLTSGHTFGHADKTDVFRIDKHTEEKQMIGVLRNKMKSTSPETDIAAINLIGTESESFAIGTKDIDGKIRQAKLVRMKTKESLTGCRVFKHGAFSGLTYGIISCNDFYSMSTFGGLENYIVITSLPGENESFLKPGDSGSVSCLSRDSDSSSIEVLSMNIGQLADGHFVSCLLAKCLEQLWQQSGVNLLQYLEISNEN